MTSLGPVKAIADFVVFIHMSVSYPFQTCLNLLNGMPRENMSTQVKKLLAGPIMPRKRNTSTASLVSLPGARSGKYQLVYIYNKR